MEDRILEIAMNTINVPKNEILNHYKELQEIDAYYFWNPVKGGLSVIVGKDETKLSATSAANFERHIQAYKSGKRN